nr:hypothetical protein [Providencia rettgeri]
MFVDCLELRIIPNSGLSSFWLLAMLEPKRFKHPRQYYQIIIKRHTVN